MSLGRESNQSARREALSSGADFIAQLLEPRILLDSVAAGAVSLSQAGFVKINWHGNAVYAKPNTWLLHIGGMKGTPAGQLRLINRKLDALRSNATATDYLGANGVFLIKAKGRTYKQLFSSIRKVRGFEYLEPDFAITTTAIPNDPAFALQWALQNTTTPGADINATQAWDITQGSSDVVVAVIDTGVNYNHPDLKNNIWQNPLEIPGDGIDNDHNGFIDDVHGWDFYNKDNDPMDNYGHGTHVAGIIAAEGNNGIGVAGVNWHVKILPLKFLGSDGSGDVRGAVAALNYCVMLRQRGVNIRVTSNSWGDFEYSQSLYDAIAANEQAGILFIAAAGNNASNNDTSPFYPASYNLPNIISVAATDNRDQPAYFTNYGANSVDLAAPGVSIYSTYPGGMYATMSGTSMATPFVSGVAALALSISPPDVSYQTIRDAIFNGGNLLPSMAGKLVTGRRLDAFGTLMQLPMRAVGMDPAAGTLIQALQQDFTVHFSHPVNAAGVLPGGFSVNSVPADTATVNGHDVTYHYNTSPISAEGLQTVSLAAGSVTRSADTAPVGAFSSTFRYDSLVPAVALASPAAGAVVGPPVTFIDLHFNEDISTASVGVDDLSVTGATVVSATPMGSDWARYMLSGVGFDTRISYQLLAGAITDPQGNPCNAYSATFDIDVSTFAWPAGFSRALPGGSLLYTSQIAGLINFAGDIDQYTLNLNAGQGLSLIATVDPSVRASLTVLDPSGHQIGATIAAAPGTPPVLSNVPIAAAGVYTIAISSTNTGTGAYTLRADLNGVVSPETYGMASDNDPLHAQSLDGAFTVLPGGGDRAAVSGRIDLPQGTLPVEVEPNDSMGNANIASYNFAPSTASLYQLGIKGNLEVAGDSDYINIGTLRVGDVLTISESGLSTQRGTLSDPYLMLYRGAPASPILVAEDDDSGPRGNPNMGADSLLWRIPITTQDTYYVRGRAYSTETGTYDLGLWLEPGSTPPLTGGTFTTETESNDTAATANDASNSWRQVNWVSTTTGVLSSTSDQDYYAFRFTAGDLVSFYARATSAVGTASALMDSSGNIIASENGLSWGTGGDSPIYSYLIPATGTYYYSVHSRNMTGSYVVSAYLSTTTPPPAPTDVPDYYSVSLSAGQALDLALKTATGGRIGMTITDALGNTLATAAPAPSVDQAVTGFVAPTAGAYYARIVGDRNLDYTLTASRDLSFNDTANTTSDAAQDISLTGRALGWLGDERWYSFSASQGDIVQVQTFTPGEGAGQFGNNLDPAADLFGPDGSLVRSDDNSAPDGRNALMTVTAPASGVYRIRLHPANGAGEYELAVTDFTSGLDGSGEDDTFTLHLVSGGSLLQIDRTQGGIAIAPLLLPVGLLSQLSFAGRGGDDQLTVDLTGGNPIPAGGLLFNGDSGNDSLHVVGAGSGDASYMPDGITSGNGRIAIAGRGIDFSGVENPVFSGLDSLDLIMPAGDDQLTLSTPSSGVGRVTGTSGGTGIGLVDFFNTRTLILDTGSNEMVPGNDVVTVGADGVGAAGLQQVQLLAGVGSKQFIMNGGNVNLLAIGPVGGQNLAVSLSGAAVLGLPTGQHLVGLSISGSARVNVVGGASKVLWLDGLDIQNIGRLDLAGNDLVISSNSASDLLKTIDGLLYTGRDSGAWDGPGIMTSVSTPYMGLAAIVNDNGSGPIRPVFDGLAPGRNAVLIKYTWNGDADLSGHIDAFDYFQADRGYRLQDPNNCFGYYNGDINYDGKVNADNLALIDQAFMHQS